MADDRVLPGAWWEDERLTGLPPVGRLSYLWLSAHADRDGFVAVELGLMVSGVGLESETKCSSALLLLDAFQLSISYRIDEHQYVWLPDFPDGQPSRGNYRIAQDPEIPGPPQAMVKEWLSQRLGRIATQKECKGSCPRAYGMKHGSKCHDFNAGVQEVWAAWRDRQKRPDSCRFTPASQSTIRGALQQARWQDLVTLIEYAYESADSTARFWRGENSGKRTYLGLDNLFRAAKLQGRLQLVLEWKSKKERSPSARRMDEVDLGPFARRAR